MNESRKDLTRHNCIRTTCQPHNHTHRLKLNRDVNHQFAGKLWELNAILGLQAARWQMCEAT